MSTTFTLRTPDATTYGPITRETLIAWARERRVPMESVLVAEDGTELPIREVPEVMAALEETPPVVPVPVAPAPPPAPDALSTVIPFRNVPALVGYYVSIASLLGILLGPFGLLVSVPALVLGIVGLRVKARRPEAKGSAHAIVAIVLGGLMTLWGLATLGLFVFAIAGG